jgi:hypothetical protein
VTNPSDQDRAIIDHATIGAGMINCAERQTFIPA